MAFNGYLIALGTAETQFPLKYMRYESYSTTPDQRLDLDSTRDTTGVLHRTVLAHTATKITFNMPMMSNREMQLALAYFKNAFSDSQARTIKVKYYDEWTNGYKSGTFYMPDINFTIRQIENGIINYGETKVTFIEY